MTGTLNEDSKLFFSKIKPFLKYSPEKLKDLFLDEFTNSFRKAFTQNNLHEINSFIFAWVDTLDIYSDLDSIKEIEEAERDFAEGKGTEWIPGMYLK